MSERYRVQVLNHVAAYRSSTPPAQRQRGTWSSSWPACRWPPATWTERCASWPGWTSPAPELEARIEAEKKAYAGYELAGHSLGVIGLGKIGCLVADAAIKPGMQVIGTCPVERCAGVVAGKVFNLLRITCVSA